MENLDPFPILDTLFLQSWSDILGNEIHIRLSSSVSASGSRLVRELTEECPLYYHATYENNLVVRVTIVLNCS